MTRDLSIRQFKVACRKHGFTPRGFMGYYNLGIKEGKYKGFAVSIWNAGSRRRDQLAYLFAERKKFEEKTRKEG
jgi:hypothetical protein